MRFSGSHSIGQNLPSSIFNLFTLATTVSYALDVFRGDGAPWKAKRMISG